jgi:hypothetical protein
VEYRLWKTIIAGTNSMSWKYRRKARKTILMHCWMSNRLLVRLIEIFKVSKCSWVMS